MLMRSSSVKKCSDSTVLIETPSACLETEIHRDLEARYPNIGLVFVHPYSLLGGSMHDAVIAEFYRQAVKGKEFGIVLRYNQRGVGASEGKKLSLKNLRGNEDAADVLDMVEFVAAQHAGETDIHGYSAKDSDLNKHKCVIVIGYSFGAHLASHCLSSPHILAYVGVSYPLGGLSSILKTKDGFNFVCAARHLPRLLVLGGMDQYTKSKVISDAVASAGGHCLRDDSSFEIEERTSTAKETQQDTANEDKEKLESQPLLFKLYPDDDHFWGTQGPSMIEHVLAWCSSIANSSK